MNKKKQSLSMSPDDASRFHFAVVVSKFNAGITAQLLKGVEECFRAHRISQKHWQVFYCPGSYELPQVANRLAAQKKWDAIICLGAIIRGETPHFEYVSSATALGIQNVSLYRSLPVVLGVLTTDNEKQALDRVGGPQGNKGWDAAVTAMEMAALFHSMSSPKRKTYA